MATVLRFEVLLPWLTKCQVMTSHYCNTAGWSWCCSTHSSAHSWTEKRDEKLKNYYRNSSECMIHSIADMNDSDKSLRVIAEIQDYKPQPRFGPNLCFLSNLWNKFWVMLAEEGEVKEKNGAVWEKRFYCCLVSFAFTFIFQTGTYPWLQVIEGS